MAVGISGVFDKSLARNAWCFHNTVRTELQDVPGNFRKCPAIVKMCTGSGYLRASASTSTIILWKSDSWRLKMVQYSSPRLNRTTINVKPVA